ncbi:undecaprenyl-diphosphate phosphatase [Candidatus Saccharibacteria bacterium]|nr:undecaprenyl-diphosphate phosphatase [Candidatus Saccharibacteria bacterium]
MLEILQAIILGIIEGLTEFLPISSTGHLIVSEELMNYKDTAEIFAVVIQSGAILAVIWFYRHDLMQKVRGLIAQDPKVVRFWQAWVIATIPAGLAGFIFQDQISKYAVSKTVAIALIIGGIVIWLIETFHKAAKVKAIGANLDSIKLTQATKIGLFQMLALIPGVSRSGATIMGGLLTGMDRVTATAFSFYLSIPILVAAGIYQMATGYDELDTVAGGGLAILAGAAAAFITALVAIKWLLKYVSHHDFKLFAYYRIILGAIILLALV